MSTETSPESSSELDPQLEYLTWLNDNQWYATEHINGLGIEVSNEKFRVFPKAVKLVTSDKDPLAETGLCIKVENAWHLTDDNKSKINNLDYVVIIYPPQGPVEHAHAEQLKPTGKLIEFDYLNRKIKVSTKDGVEILPVELPKKNIALMRLGAIGDLIQTSSVAAAAKKEGYHVTVYAQNPAGDVLENNPNIDRLVRTDRDIVSNPALSQYWNWLKKRHSKFVNLCESVEATWLPNKDKMSFYWPYAVRHKYMDTNYVQFMHELAELPYKLKVKFYPTDDELKWAAEERAKMPEEQLVCWVLNGSSVHKVYPYLDIIVGATLTQTKAGVVTLGDEGSSILEAGWQEEPRVHKKAGKWTIRQSLTFIQKYATVLIGPETGPMNAMCCEPMPKVMFLSHSTKNNLTRDWVNTTSLTAPEIELKKCDHCCLHRLHAFPDGFSYIMRDEETGVAHCQARIHPNRVWDVVSEALNKKKPKLKVVR